jgi:hypothetical protein
MSSALIPLRCSMGENIVDSMDVSLAANLDFAQLKWLQLGVTKKKVAINRRFE